MASLCGSAYDFRSSLNRGQTAKARRTTIPQPVEGKPHSQKHKQDEKAESYVPDEGTRKTPEKQLNGVEIGNLPEKEFRIIVKMIQNLGNRMEKIQETFNKDRRTKEQTNSDEQHNR